MGLTILGMVQHAKFKDEQFGISSVKIDKKEATKPKKTDQPEVIFDKEDDSIIILDESAENKFETPVEIPIDQQSSKEDNKISYYLAFLTILLGFHLLILSYFSSLSGINFYSVLFFTDFSQVNYIIASSLFVAVIIIFILYNKVERFKKYITFPPSVRRAFLEFLSLIDREERTRLLRNISGIIQQIIVEGLVELLESEKGNIIDTIGEGIRRGAKLFRKFFGE